MAKEFYQKRNQDNITKLRGLLHDLPCFCQEFFLGIENRTAVLTRVGYAYDLRIFFDFLVKEIDVFVGQNIKEIEVSDLDSIKPTHLEMYLQHLSYYTYNGEEYSNDECAKSRKLSSVKTMFKYFFKREKILSNVTEKVELPKLHHKEIVRLEADEVVKLLDEVEYGNRLSPREHAFHAITKVRDLAIITLLLGTGMRISECVGLNEEDIDFNNYSVKIIRKGGGESILYLSDEVISAVNGYIKYKQKKKEDDAIKNVNKQAAQIKDIDKRALFVSIRNTRLSVRAVEMLVKKYASKVTPLKHITPHKLRSTYGTSLYRETKDIYIVADILGHKDVNTTKKHYAAMSDDIRRQAANKVKLRED